MKLELKHLIPYMPYKLQIKYGDSVRTMNAASGSSSNWIGLSAVINRQERETSPFPILRPLSDFDKIINPKNLYAFVPVERIVELRGSDLSDAEWDWLEMLENDPELIHTEILKCSYEMMQYFLSWHFDVFGLLDNGLAVNINNLK